MKADSELIKKHHFNILVTEDDEMSFLYLSIILKDLSKSIIHAKTGREALDILSSDVFDLAFLDINLPDISGLKIARACRKAFPQMGIIINSSEYPDEQRLKQLKKMHVEYLIKPITPNKIQTTIEKALNRLKEN